jgi:radical SAM family RiPP maturation amino acid epimerase
MSQSQAVRKDHEGQGFLLDAILQRWSPEELFIIAHIKRFAECFTGDEEFRQALLKNPENCDAMAKARGCLISPKKIPLLWQRGILREIPEEELAEYPYLKLWGAWIKDMIALREAVKEMGRTASINDRFDAWRLRQIARCEHELGDNKGTIVHSILAFELAKGCSVGCWFCGLSAQPLAKVYQATDENIGLWQDILKVCVETFGTAAQVANCYWATEPFDNPDYLSFVESFSRICGAMPQTTTAMPLRDISATKDMLALRKRYPSVPDRFSILSTAVLRKVHTLFSAEELLGVELIMQQQDAGEGGVSKTLAGRFRDKQGDNPAMPLGLGTISCTSGFVVNMAEHSIRLVSPCRASARWPQGYRVHAEGTFYSGAEFKAFIETAIAEHMKTNVANNQVLAFHPALEFTAGENGFSLRSPFKVYNLAGGPHMALLGKLLSDGDHSTQLIIKELLAAGANPFFVWGTINDLFSHGLLCD